MLASSRILAEASAEVAKRTFLSPVRAAIRI